VTVYERIWISCRSCWGSGQTMTGGQCQRCHGEGEYLAETWQQSGESLLDQSTT